MERLVEWSVKDLVDLRRGSALETEKGVGPRDAPCVAQGAGADVRRRSCGWPEGALRALVRCHSCGWLEGALRALGAALTLGAAVALGRLSRSGSHLERFVRSGSWLTLGLSWAALPLVGFT